MKIQIFSKLKIFLSSNIAHDNSANKNPTKSGSNKINGTHTPHLQMEQNHSALLSSFIQNHHQQSNNLHKHVCSIASKCTCEKKFLVDKIGEGKYRIGNTKNIVFIRILRNHIMVRVGGGWDTLENYLNKHDPCRCPSDFLLRKDSAVGSSIDPSASSNVSNSTNGSHYHSRKSSMDSANSQTIGWLGFFKYLSNF